MPRFGETNRLINFFFPQETKFNQATSEGWQVWEGKGRGLTLSKLNNEHR